MFWNLCRRMSCAHNQSVIFMHRRNCRCIPKFRLARISLCVVCFCVVLLEDVETTLSTALVTKIIPDRMLTDTTFVLSLYGIGIDSVKFVAISQPGPGACNISSILVTASTSSQESEVISAKVPSINSGGTFAICISDNSSLSSAYFVQQDVLLSIVTVFGISPSALYTQVSAQSLQLECEGECAGPYVKIGFSFSFSDRCSFLMGNTSISYNVKNHNGSAVAVYPFVIQAIGIYDVCWSADGGISFYPTNVSVNAIRQAGDASITNIIPSSIRQAHEVYMIFLPAADCSPSSYVAFIPTTQSSCTNISLIVPLICSTNCSKNVTCATVNFPRSMNVGLYRVCFSTSGRNGQYVAQTQLSTNISLFGADCTMCVAGEIAVSDSSNSSPPVCVKCKPGFFCSNGSSQMIPCPNGTFSQSPGSSSIQDCLSCDAGSYSNFGAAFCSPCESGFFCIGGLMYSCARGSYSAPGESICIVCPAGSFCKSPFLRPLPCLSGSFSLSNQTSCTQCPLGTWSKYAASSCLNCPPGSIILLNGSACVPCPAGYFCNSTVKIRCPIGTFSNGSAPTCTPCPLNSVSDCGASVCVPCPPGTRGDSIVGCTQCDSGYYSRNGTLPCFPCPAGSACPNGSSILSCSLGYYSHLGSSACMECPAGFACPSPAQPKMQIECEAGTFALAGQTVCLLCPAGYYCNDTKSDSRNSCPNGTFSSSGQTACTVCSAGSYCTDGIVSRLCPPGTFSAAQSSTLEECIACPFGYFAPSSGSSACFECPAGHACQNRSFAVLCLAGSFSLSGDEI